MKVVRINKDRVEIEAETEDDHLVLNKFKDNAQQLEAEKASLKKQVRILADDNKYLIFMLEKNKIKFDFSSKEE
jgi:hypothetical protein